MNKPLKIFICFSGSASSWRYLQEHDPEYNKNYIVVGALTDKKQASAISLFEKANIPCIPFDYKEWSKYIAVSDKEVRRGLYFEDVTKAIMAIANPDLMILSGFMRIVSENFWKEFFVINVHPADLSIEENGKRKYIGDDAVTLALLAGEKETRSTVHEVNGVVDGGPIICMSEPLLVEKGCIAKDHQEKMKSACDGPAMQKAIQMIISGKYKRQVYT